MMPENYFLCPICKGKCDPVYEAHDPRDVFTWVKCSECKEVWSPVYIRAFWAGYAKRENEERKIN